MCNICGQPDYLRCNCISTQPFCDQCESESVCVEKVDSSCVIYHFKSQEPSKLVNLNLPNGSSVEAILEAIDNLVGNGLNVTFEGQDSLSIKWTPGGPVGHEPSAEVIISPDVNNQLIQKANGLFAKAYNENYYVKVSSPYAPGYLENKLIGDNNGIVYITMVNDTGVLKAVPGLDITALLNEIINNTTYRDIFCDLVNLCGGGPIPATLTTLDCLSAIIGGSYVNGVPVVGGSLTIPYTGGNGGFYTAISVNSTGVTGLTASVASGSVASGAGNIVLAVTGTPSGIGVATFNITLGGQNCNVQVNVLSTLGTISSLTCGSATYPTDLVIGGPITPGNVVIPYLGGNGGSYPMQNINSTGVTGLTLTLSAGNFNVGAGNLTYTITGTPSASGIATFNIVIGGQNCVLNITTYSFNITHTMAGVTGSNVSSTGLNYAPAFNTGADIYGDHAAFTGGISIDLTGTVIVSPSNVSLYKNGVLLECITVLAGTLPLTINFASQTYLASDFVEIAFNTGSC